MGEEGWRFLGDAVLWRLGRWQVCISYKLVMQASPPLLLIPPNLKKGMFKCNMPDGGLLQVIQQSLRL